MGADTPEQQCRAAFNAAPDATWAWHLHHELLVEPLTEPAANRIAYILSDKPEEEQALRLTRFRPVLGTLPEAVVKAWAAYDKAWAYDKAAYDKAWAAYDKAVGGLRQGVGRLRQGRLRQGRLRQGEGRLRQGVGQGVGHLRQGEGRLRQGEGRLRQGVERQHARHPRPARRRVWL